MRAQLAAVLVVVAPLVALVPLVGDAAPAKSSPPAIGGKSPPACGVKLLPLVVGNEWTYTAVKAPFDATEQITKLAPAEPVTIVVTVKSIDKKGADTVATLEEKSSINLSKDKAKPQLVDRTITTTITCNATKFDISPDSLYFAGEPGGYLGMSIDNIDRKATTTPGPTTTSWKLVNGAIGDQKWEEDVELKWTRTATPGSNLQGGTGKVNLERVFQPAQPEKVISALGNWDAEKLGLTTTGRVTLDGAAADAKPMELPANWIAFIWLSPNVGIVQLLNPYAHMYQLTGAKLN